MNHVLAEMAVEPLDLVFYMAVSLTMVTLAANLEAPIQRFIAAGAMAGISLLAVLSGYTAFSYIISGGAIGLLAGTVLSEHIAPRLRPQRY